MLKIKTKIVFLAACLVIVSKASGSDYDSNDFAAEVIEYVQGSGIPNDLLTGQPFNNPATALGRPTLETTGDGFYIPPGESVPVVPAYGAFRYFEIVTVGNGGRLTLKFEHAIANDAGNLYGIDFIIYGNANQTIAAGQHWTNGNPELTTVTGTVSEEPGIVAISQDGVNWFYFNDGPYADSFAPTAGYEWNEVEDIWTDELDPTRPIDPNLTAGAMNCKTVAEIIGLYDGSSGGTGFDIGLLGLDWIQYVRIEDNPASSVTTEIDAVADVSCCGDYKHPQIIGDLNEDCRIDFFDFALLAQDWETSSDWQSLDQMAENWLSCNYNCD